MTCTGPACDRLAWAQGLCNSHYTQQRRGLILRPLRDRRAEVPWRKLDAADALAAAWTLAPIDPATGCRPWPTLNERGYGVVTIAGKLLRAHRFVWELAVGPIPDGLTLDHECHNRAAWAGLRLVVPCAHRACVELSHLVPRTSAANTAASPLPRRALRTVPG